MCRVWDLNELLAAHFPCECRCGCPALVGGDLYESEDGWCWDCEHGHHGGTSRWGDDHREGS